MSDMGKVGVHVSDESLICLLSDELPLRELRDAESHLANCWECRARRERLEQVVRKVVSYGKCVAGASGKEPPDDTDPFIRKLEAEFGKDPGHRWWPRVMPQLRFLAIPAVNPVFSSVLIAAAALLFFLIWQRNPRTVTASEFIARAVAADTDAAQKAGSEVVYQRFQVRTRKGKFERAVYRDLSGRRKPRESDDAVLRKQLEAKLAIAGVGWNEPLSPASFKTWHDGQSHVEDRVTQTGDGLLTLTTRASEGIVAEESLTVREETFHVVERTVEFLDLGPVAICEIDYDVLSRDAVDGDVFEPEFKNHSAGSHVAPAPAIMPVAPLTASELDEAELGARLALNKLGAEFTERLQVVRKPTGIEVRGIVPTEERKQEIVSGLRSLEHVSAVISSFADMNSGNNGGGGFSSVTSASIVAQEPSLLEAYLVSRGRSRDESSHLASELYRTAIAIEQQTSGIESVRDRFSSGETLSEQGRAVLEELLSRHAAELLALLTEEQRLLADTGIRSSAQPSTDTPSDPGKARTAAETNLRLSKELTSGSDTNEQSAEALIPQMLEAVGQLRRFLGKVKERQPSFDQNEKP